MRKPKPTQLAWLAGLFDGEGCIHIHRQRATSRPNLRNDSFRLVAQITLGNKAVLDRCQQLTGLGTVQPHTVGNKKHNAAWCWMMTNNHAIRMIRMLASYLVLKVEEAHLAFDFFKLPLWQPGGRGGATPKDPLLVEESKRFYWRMRMLKPRWPYYRAKLSRRDRREIRQLGLKA